jgi:hypothetical protein
MEGCCIVVVQDLSRAAKSGFFSDLGEGMLPLLGVVYRASLSIPATHIISAARRCRLQEVLGIWQYPLWVGVRVCHTSWQFLVIESRELCSSNGESYYRS